MSKASQKAFFILGAVLWGIAFALYLLTDYKPSNEFVGIMFLIIILSHINDAFKDNR